jgi:hypothetical protein
MQYTGSMMPTQTMPSTFIKQIKQLILLANMSQLTSQRLSSGATYELVRIMDASLDGKNRLGHFTDASVTAIKVATFIGIKFGCHKIG